MLIAFFAPTYCLVPSNINSCSCHSILSVLNARSNGATLENPAVHPVKPRKSTKKERERAIEALDRKKGADILSEHIVDESGLERMFRDENFAVENTRHTVKDEKPRKPPHGRPKMVAGAMGFRTMLDYRNREATDYEKKINTSTYSPVAIAPSLQPPVTDPTTLTNELSHKSAIVKVTKDVEYQKKDRPKPIGRSERNKKSVDSEGKYELVGREKGRRKGKYHMTKGLKHYYETELLTAKEEYSLGMKIQLMVQCDSVHEGLSMKLKRLPTFQEWAEACGFSEKEPDFFESEVLSELRPTGHEQMFLEKDPNLFVGNGLASAQGVGRGHGRAKKPPPTRLENFYDDTDNKFRSKKSKQLRKVLKNKGSPSDFVDKLIEGRVAKQRMVSSNMRLVLSISRKYQHVGVSLLDLVQEGSLGLSRAAEKFEPKKGFKFSTYASWWIQQAVFRAIAYHSRTIRLPVHVHNLLNRIRKIRRNLEQELARPPTNEEMAKQLDMPVEKYNKMMKLTRRSISLETPKFRSNPKDGGKNVPLLKDTVVSTKDDIPSTTGVDRSLFHRDLKDMLKMLEDDERRVISARYGLEDGLSRTVTTVAAQMNMSKTWVRSQECRALRKLRRPWYEKRLKEHQDSLQS